jgi:hypothetical protein
MRPTREWKIEARTVPSLALGSISYQLEDYLSDGHEAINCKFNRGELARSRPKTRNVLVALSSQGTEQPLERGTSTCSAQLYTLV